MTSGTQEAAAPTTSPTAPGRSARVAGLARRHLGLLLLLVVAGGARLAVVRAYPTALWFPDSLTYLNGVRDREPAVDRPFGYSAFLGVLHRFMGFWGVAVVQHVLGLAVVALVYALLHRRGAPRWVCLVAAVPVALDAYVLDIEHFVLAETLFMFVLTVAVVTLLWQERPGPLVVGVVGVLVGALALIRTTGTPLAGVLLLYLLVRVVLRTLRWPVLVSFLLGLAVTLVPYSAWFASAHGTYALTDYTGHFLYGRVADFVRCEELDVPPRLQALCPSGAPEDRPTGDFFTWNGASPANATADGVPRWSEDDLKQFAELAIAGQPLDYARVVVSEMWHYASPGRHSSAQDTCPLWWSFPTPVLYPPTTCVPVLAPLDPDREPVWDTALITDLRAYQQVGYTPGPLLAGCVLAGLAALLVPGGRPRERLDPGLLAVLGVALVGVPAATASFDYRYLLPTLVVLPAAGALAVCRVLPRWRSWRHREREAPG